MESKLHYGKRIERQACHWLLERNSSLKLIGENYRWRGGELDLIFEDASPVRGSELVFVEVRARLVGSWTTGVESVTFAKQLRLVRTIRHFLSRYRGGCKTLRVDILAWNGKEWCHSRNVRLPE